LLFLESENPEKDISFYINSPGGSVSAGMAIYDTMNFIKPDVSTLCTGMAASMGAFLLSAGTKGKRFSLPNSKVMIHQPLGGTRGQLPKLRFTPVKSSKLASNSTESWPKTQDKPWKRSNWTPSVTIICRLTNPKNTV